METNTHTLSLSLSLPQSLAVSPTNKEPPSPSGLESTAVALLQSKQQLPSRRSLHRSESSVHRVGHHGDSVLAII